MPRPLGGPKFGGRVKGTPNKINAKTREALWALIDERIAQGQQANPFEVALELMLESTDERLRLQCAEFLGDRLLPKLRAMEHSGEVIRRVYTVELE